MDNEQPFLIINAEHSIIYEVSASGILSVIQPVNDRKTGEVIGTETTQIANHSPILKNLLTVDDGTEITEKIVFQPLRAGRMWKSETLTLKDILSANPNENFGAGCRIYIGKSTKQFYSQFMQIQAEKAESKTLFKHTGFTEIDGKRVFLNQNFSVDENGLTNKYDVVLDGKLDKYGFTDEKSPDRYKTLIEDLPKIAPKELVYPCLAYSFLTPLNRLLRECGCEPRFVMYLCGKTGTNKSTIANLFLNFFGKFYEGETSPLSFNDTENASCYTLSLLDSTCTLLDDRIPDLNRQIQLNMENREQAILRAIGDRAGKQRLNADSTLKPVHRPVANCFITSEEIFKGVGESGTARAFCCEIQPDTVKSRELFKVQTNKSHLNQIMSEYIQFVIQNWDKLKSELKNKFYELRDKARSVGHGRLAESVAHLEIGILTMCKWLQSIEIITEAQTQKLCESAWNVFFSLAQQQQQRIVSATPTTMFINAISQLINSNSLNIATLNKDNEVLLATSITDIIGYEDNNYFYFYPDKIYNAVCQFYSAQESCFPSGKTSLFRNLKQEGIIECEDKSATKKKKIKRGGKDCRQRLLWLRKSAIDNDGKEKSP